MNNQNIQDIARSVVLPEDAIRRAAWPEDMRIQRVGTASELSQFAVWQGPMVVGIWAPTLEDLMASDWNFYGNNYAKV